MDNFFAEARFCPGKGTEEKPMKNNQQDSIFSVREEEYLLKRLSDKSRRQLESLSENKILDQFLHLVAPSDELLAFEHEASRISWTRNVGISVDIADSLYLDSSLVSEAIQEVRRVFFESFVDDEVLEELASSESTQDSAVDMDHEKVATEASDSQEEEDSSDEEPVEESPLEEEEDLLSRVGELDQNTLSGDGEEIHADEFSNLSEIQSEDAQSESQDPPVEQDAADIDALIDAEMAEEESAAESTKDVDSSPAEESEETDDSPETVEEPDPADIDAEMAGEPPEEESAAPEASEGSETNPTDSADIDALINAETTGEKSPVEEQADVEEAEPETEPAETSQGAESEVDETASEPSELDSCINQLKELGMEDERIETLVSAVREGKAPIELVKKTIEKLSN